MGAAPLLNRRCGSPMLALDRSAVSGKTWVPPAPQDPDTLPSYLMDVLDQLKQTVNSEYAQWVRTVSLLADPMVAGSGESPHTSRWA